MAYNRFEIFNELELCLLETAINNLLAEEEESHALLMVDRAAASLTKLLEEVQSAND